MRGPITLVLIAVLIPGALRGQVTIGPEGPVLPEAEKEPDRDQPRVYQFTITPAPEPVPALKYRFDVPPSEQKPGNSVPFYYRALIQLRQDNSLDRLKQIYALQEEAEEMPLSDFPMEKAREALAPYQNIFQELERAYVREETDWGWHMEELRGTEWIGFLLPEIQDSRELARLLYLKGRVELAEGRFDDAEQTLRMGYHLARAAGEEPLIINKLVGIAITSIMNQLLRDWIDIKDSPNIYWAIAALPDPLVDMRPALEYELGFATRFAPWLEDAEEDDAPPAVWRERFTSLMHELLGFSGSIINEDLSGLAFTGLSLQHYPQAKRALVDRGYSTEEVEAMPVGQVIAIQQRYLNQRVADEMLKQALVRPARAAEVNDRSEAELKEQGLYGRPMSALSEPIPMMSLLLPATGQAGHAVRRREAEFAGLRTLEAIRMHAAKTGKFPKSLDKIEIVPVPDNPITGKPFDYSLDGETAVLVVVIDPRHPQINSRFELTLDSSAKK